MDKLYSLREATEILGISVKHIQKLDREGKIRCVRTLGGRRRISESELRRIRGEPIKKEIAAIYARVSSSEQKKKGDLARQIKILREFCRGKYEEVEEITDVGSGLNDKRAGILKLIKLAQQGKISEVIVTDKDRLTRFGFNYLAECFKCFGVKIYVIGEEVEKNMEEELVKDMLSIVTSFSGKLYGIRSKKRKKILKEIRETVKTPEEKIKEI